MKTIIDKATCTGSGLNPDPHPEIVDKGGDKASVKVNMVEPAAVDVRPVAKVGCPIDAFYY